MSDVNDLLRGAMNERELDLFDAFRAGFWASGEQFNSDHLLYPYFVYDKAQRSYVLNEEEFTKRLLEAFTEWRNA